MNPRIIIAIVLTLLLTTGAKAAAARAKKPNVLIFLMDDMGYGDITAMNPRGGGIPTPNLDRLVADGVFFSHAHSSASVCAPSRYALLTGNHVYRGTQPMGTWGMFCPSQIRPNQRTIADLLRDNGYATAFFGKLHLGGQFHKADGSFASGFQNADLTKRFSDGPLDHGFDYSLTLPAGIQASPYAFFEKDRLSRWDNKSGSFQHFDKNEVARRHFRQVKRNNKTVYEMDNWSTESVGPLLMNRALHFIDQHVERHGPARPFFIHYCSQAGHTPYKPPAAFNVSEPMNTIDVTAPGAISIAGKTVSKRTDMIYEGDVAIGLFIAKLRDKNLLDNTVIVFTSDNGVAKGIDYRWDNPIHTDTKDGPYGGNRTEYDPSDSDRKHVNGQGVAKDGTPLRGKKGFIYEGGHRVPLVFRWGARIRSGHRVDGQLMALHDLFATIASLTSCPTTEQDGLDSYDFSPVLLAPAKQTARVRKLMFVQGNRPAEKGPSTPRQMTWAAYNVASIAQDHSVVWKAIIQNGRDTLKTLGSSSFYELFDLTADPGESTPVDISETSQNLHLTFKNWLRKERTAPSY